MDTNILTLISKNQDAIFSNVCVLLKQKDLIEVIFLSHPNTLTKFVLKNILKEQWLLLMLKMFGSVCFI